MNGPCVVSLSARTAVDKIGRGKERQVNARFSAMVSHFLFEAEFCNPASGWEKGQIEKNVQDARHRLWQPNSVVNWFVALYQELRFEGCSSHSGRRSFITVAARNIHRSGCSLRDVQLLAGHRSIETTERYIDGDTWAQRRLVAYI
jgi:integrase